MSRTAQSISQFGIRWGWLGLFASQVAIGAFLFHMDGRYVRVSYLDEIRQEAIRQRGEDLEQLDRRIQALAAREEANREQIVELRIVASRLLAVAERLERAAEK